MPREENAPPRKPAGGYQLIPAVHLALAWWCYRAKLIRLADLRVWFAAWEMRARRCRRPSPLPRRFGLAELQRLTGLSPRRLAESLRRLQAAGLLTWSGSAIGFPASSDAVPLPDPAAFGRFLDRIPNHRRRVPVPRRILRLLAGGARPALIATILGHLLRCLYLKEGGCSARGRVKASWIADTFGVALRRVKEARRELVALGWLIPLEAGQWELNRWGAHVRINLDWSRLDGVDGRPVAAAGGQALAPPAPDSGAGSAPPESDEEPLRDVNNQEPAQGGPTGVYNGMGEEKSTEPAQPLPSVVPAAAPAAGTTMPGAATGQADAGPAGKPNLRHVVPEDLRDTGRLLDLYEQAVGRGMALPSEWGRLRFVAVAEHARVVGTKNPCGLFARLVRAGLWHFATGDDEAAASVRLRRHLHGEMPQRRVEPAAGIRPGPGWSDDARLVQAVREVAARAGLRGDPFPLLKREKPEWSRERWDRAVEELDNPGGIGR
jgi:hypothetical protein